MKSPLSAKIILLAALAAASSWATSKLLAKQPSGRPVTTPAKVIASGQMKPVEVQIRGTSVEVQATARIHEERPLVKYYWKVQVREAASKTIVHERLYLEDGFKPKAGDSEPKFSEMLEFPPGRYLATVMLVDFPDGGDLEILGDPEAALPYVMATGSEEFTVPAE